MEAKKIGLVAAVLLAVVGCNSGKEDSSVAKDLQAGCELTTKGQAVVGEFGKVEFICTVPSSLQGSVLEFEYSERLANLKFSGVKGSGGVMRLVIPNQESFGGSIDVFFERKGSLKIDASVKDVSAEVSFQIQAPAVKVTKIADDLPTDINNQQNLIATENKLFYMDQNEVHSSADGKNWSQVTLTGYPRADEHPVVYDGTTFWSFANAYRLGGYVSAANDVYKSSDGKTWTRVRADGAASGFTKRKSSAAVFFKDKLWVLGGRAAVGAHTDVWSSADGISWTLATANAGWRPRWEFDAVVFQEKMWVVGGVTYERGSGNLAATGVWSSADGQSWNKEGNLPVGVMQHATETFNGRLWVIGGLDRNERHTGGRIWFSKDGQNWAEAGVLNSNVNKSWDFYSSAVFQGNLYFVSDGQLWKISM